jgi:hypothetical protein
MNFSTAGQPVTVTALPSKGSAINAQTLINNSIIIVSCTMAICLIGRLMLYMALPGLRPQGRQMSASMYFYLLMHMLGCATTLPYYSYIALQWMGARCDPLLFIVMLEMRFFYALVSPVPITVLALDRCLVIRLAASWTAQRRIRLVVAGCLLVAVLQGVNMAFTPIDGPLAAPAKPTDACPNPPINDIHNTYKTRMKDVLEAMDLTVSLSLFFLIRKYQVGDVEKRQCRYG